MFAWGREEAGMEEGLQRSRKKVLRVKDMFIILITGMVLSFRGGSVVKKKKKNLNTNAGDSGSIPGWGRSAGEGNGNPFQGSCLENCMDRVAWRATVHGAAESQTRLSDETTAVVL